MDLENAKPDMPQSPIAEDIHKNYLQHKELYEKLRADVAIKMQFLDENRVLETIVYLSFRDLNE